MTAPATRTPIEITLPSGIFARIRPVQFIDGLIASARSNELEKVIAGTPGDSRAGVPMYVAALIAQVVLFDDQVYSIQQVLDLDSRDAGPVCDALLPYMKGPMR